MPDELLTHEFFAPLVGTNFRIVLDAEESTIELCLTEVTPLPPPRRRNDAGETIPATHLPARLEPFSLLFTGPLDRPLPQRTYRMTRAGDSTPAPLDIFIVPIARERDGYVYQAIFG